jgi:hypothetical protein
VTFLFRGLRNLRVIHDRLEHGAELAYSEHIGLTEEQVLEWVNDKDQLDVFGPTGKSSDEKPNYRSAAVMEEVYRLHPHLRPVQTLH